MGMEGYGLCGRDCRYFVTSGEVAPEGVPCPHTPGSSHPAIRKIQDAVWRLGGAEESLRNASPELRDSKVEGDLLYSARQNFLTEVDPAIASLEAGGGPSLVTRAGDRFARVFAQRCPHYIERNAGNAELELPRE